MTLLFLQAGSCHSCEMKSHEQTCNLPVCQYSPVLFQDEKQERYPMLLPLKFPQMVALESQAAMPVFSVTFLYSQAIVVGFFKC